MPLLLASGALVLLYTFYSKDNCLQEKGNYKNNNKKYVYLLFNNKSIRFISLSYIFILNWIFSCYYHQRQSLIIFFQKGKR